MLFALGIACLILGYNVPYFANRYGWFQNKPGDIDEMSHTLYVAGIVLMLAQVLN